MIEYNFYKMPESCLKSRFILSPGISIKDCTVLSVVSSDHLSVPKQKKSCAFVKKSQDVDEERLQTRTGLQNTTLLSLLLTVFTFLVTIAFNQVDRTRFR